MIPRAILCIAPVLLLAARLIAGEPPPTVPPQPADPVFWLWADPSRIPTASASLETAALTNQALASLRRVFADDEPGLQHAESLIGLAAAANRPFAVVVDSVGPLHATFFIAPSPASSPADHAAANVQLDDRLAETQPSDGLSIKNVSASQLSEDPLPLWNSQTAGELSSHRRAANENATKGEPIAACFVNLNALRRQFDDTFADGPASRILRAAHISNARSIMLHARFIPATDVPTLDPSLPLLPAMRANAPKYTGPPLIAIDATWSSRAEKPGTIHRGAVASSHWPVAILGAAPPEAPCLVCFHVEWMPLLQSALDAYSAWLAKRERDPLDNRAAAWHRRNTAEVSALQASLTPWVIVRLGHPPATNADKHHLRWSVLLREDSKSAEALTSLGRVLQGFKPRRDKTTGAWSLQFNDPAASWLAKDLEWNGSSLVSPSGKRDVIEGSISFGPSKTDANPDPQPPARPQR